MKSSAKALLVYKNKLLLILRDNIESLPDANTWSAPGGEVENDEIYEETIRRELQEEINIIPKNLESIGTLATPNGISHGIFFAQLTDDEHLSLKLGSEGQSMKFFYIDELENIQLSRNLKQYIGIVKNELKKIIEDNAEINPEKLHLTNVGGKIV